MCEYIKVGFTKPRKKAPKTDEMLDDLADGLQGVTTANSTATSIFATPALASSSTTVSRRAEWPPVRLPIRSVAGMLPHAACADPLGAP